jgi:hypothetical protein
MSTTELISDYLTSLYKIESLKTPLPGIFPQPFHPKHTHTCLNIDMSDTDDGECVIVFKPNTDRRYVGCVYKVIGGAITPSTILNIGQDLSLVYYKGCRLGFNARVRADDRPTSLNYTTGTMKAATFSMPMSEYIQQYGALTYDNLTDNLNGDNQYLEAIPAEEGIHVTSYPRVGQRRFTAFKPIEQITATLGNASYNYRENSESYSRGLVLGNQNINVPNVSTLVVEADFPLDSLGGLAGTLNYRYQYSTLSAPCDIIYTTTITTFDLFGNVILTNTLPNFVVTLHTNGSSIGSVDFSAGGGGTYSNLQNRDVSSVRVSVSANLTNASSTTGGNLLVIANTSGTDSDFGGDITPTTIVWTRNLGTELSLSVPIRTIYASIPNAELSAEIITQYPQHSMKGLELIRELVYHSEDMGLNTIIPASDIPRMLNLTIGMPPDYVVSASLRDWFRKKLKPAKVFKFLKPVLKPMADLGVGFASEVADQAIPGSGRLVQRYGDKVSDYIIGASMPSGIIPKSLNDTPTKIESNFYTMFPGILMNVIDPTESKKAVLMAVVKGNPLGFRTSVSAPGGYKVFNLAPGTPVNVRLTCDVSLVLVTGFHDSGILSNVTQPPVVDESFQLALQVFRVLQHRSVTPPQCLLTGGLYPDMKTHRIRPVGDAELKLELASKMGLPIVGANGLFSVSVTKLSSAIAFATSTLKRMDYSYKNLVSVKGPYVVKASSVTELMALGAQAADPEEEVDPQDTLQGLLDDIDEFGRLLEGTINKIDELVNENEDDLEFDPRSIYAAKLAKDLLEARVGVGGMVTVDYDDFRTGLFKCLGAAAVGRTPTQAAPSKTTATTTPVRVPPALAKAKTGRGPAQAAKKPNLSTPEMATLKMQEFQTLTGLTFDPNSYQKVAPQMPAVIGTIFSQYGPTVETITYDTIDATAENLIATDAPEYDLGSTLWGLLGKVDVTKKSLLNNILAFRSKNRELLVAKDNQLTPQQKVMKKQLIGQYNNMLNLANPDLNASAASDGMARMPQKQRELHGDLTAEQVKEIETIANSRPGRPDWEAIIKAYRNDKKIPSVSKKAKSKQKTPQGQSNVLLSRFLRPEIGSSEV